MAFILSFIQALLRYQDMVVEKTDMVSHLVKVIGGRHA
jgi:hypothetical protein